MKKILLIATASIIVIAAIYGAVKFMGSPATASNRPATEYYIAPTRSAPAGMKEYRNEQYRFSIFIPNEVKVTERDEGQGAATLTFEDIQSERGFEVFVVPHIDPQVSTERFRQDIPSGVRENVQDVSIDGAVGASFRSVHEPLGETSEVWFVRDGYLYEVMTVRPLEAWLAEVMTTWDFL